MADMYSLYIATNKVNGKQYVGMTSGTLRQRRTRHLAATNAGSRYKFHNALRKYGLESFDWEVVACATDKQSCAAAEIDLIAQVRPVYNLTAGGEGVSMRREGEVLRRSQENIRRAGHIRRQNPNWKEEQRTATTATWEDPDVRARREAGLQSAAARIDQVAKGRKISLTKSAPEAREKTRQQSKARVAADGGAQIRAALTKSWDDPNSREKRAASIKASHTPEYRAKQRINSIIQHATRRGEIELWLKEGA